MRLNPKIALLFASCIRKSILTFLFCICLVITNANNERKFDSLKTRLTKNVSDSDKLNILYQMANGCSPSNEIGMQYSQQGLRLAEDRHYKGWIVRFLQVIGNQYCNEGDFSNALDYYLKEVNEIEKNGMSERTKIGVYNGIGNIYAAQNNYDKALEYYTKGLEAVNSLGSKYTGATFSFYNNIASMFLAKREYNKSLKYSFRLIAIMDSTGSKEPYTLGSIYAIIGNVYDSVRDLEGALKYYTKSIEEFKSQNNTQMIGSADVNIGNLYNQEKHFEISIPYFNDAVQKGTATQAKDIVEAAYYGLSEAYFAEGEYKQAYQFHKKYSEIKDSVLNLASRKQMNEMETKYESAAKDKELIKREAESKRQKILIYFILAIALAAGVIAILIFRSLRTSNRQKAIISIQKSEVERQKVLVEEKNKDILDSITYAKRLQDAILPPLSSIKHYLPEFFLLYRPKDIVAGDFYWMERAGDGILIAAADCTGHGVPGAMVSVVCCTALNRAVKEFKIIEPGKILDKAREIVLETFEKGQDNVQDGMDISLCYINRKTNEVQWSGAYNSLCYIHNGEIHEVPADKQPIGKHDKPVPFNTHKLNLQKGDALYLFTDGYADQFGGPKGKKFKYKQMEQLLLANTTEPMDEQKRALESALEVWKGTLEQVDDILVLGIEV